MNKYEAIYILSTDLEEQARVDMINRINGLVTANNGTVDKVDEWGKRRLAYPINKANEGYYVQMLFSSDNVLPAELERNFRNFDAVLRYLVVRIEE